VLLAAELTFRALDGIFIFSIDNLVDRVMSPLRWANGALIFDDKLGWRLKPRFKQGGQGPDGSRKLTFGQVGLRAGL
jgi:hypothetical protein